MDWLTNIIGWLVCSGFFLLIYKLFLEAKIAHRTAGVYLTAAMLVSVVIPLLKLPLYPAETVFVQIPVALSGNEPAVSESVETSAANWLNIAVIGLYGLIVLTNLTLLANRLIRICALRRKSKLEIYNGYTVARHDSIKEPFSFGRTVYLGSGFSPENEQLVIAHETSHIRHRHSAENMLLELLRCFMWFNPFVWLAQHSLSEVHEWEADSDVIRSGCSLNRYRELIFTQLFGYNPDITSGLKSQISKKRFIMMTNSKRGKYSSIRLALALPAVALMVLAFGSVRAEATAVAETPKGVETENPEKVMVIRNSNDTGLQSNPIVIVDGKVYEKSLEEIAPSSIKMISVYKNTKESKAAIEQILKGTSFTLKDVDERGLINVFLKE